MTAALIETGDTALKAGRWQQAADAFRAALGGPQHGEALLGLGQALWWLGDMAEAMGSLERAYACFRQRPDPLHAAICALRLSLHQSGHLGNAAAAAGWLARAARLIEDHQLELLTGELLLLKAYVTEDAHASETWAREAHEWGRRAGDVDLELCSLSQLGASLVEQGRVEEGLALLGEAMAACLGGETANLETVVFASCRTMVSCARCADFGRAVQWVHAAERVAQQHAVPFLHAECRVVYANVLFATGEWRRAEQTAKAALAMARQGRVPAYEAAALATLADLHVAQGRLEEAERLVVGFEGHHSVVPVLAGIQLRRGRAALAAATVERRLQMIGERRIESALLLELLGEADITQGRADAAAARASALIELGTSLGCEVAAARGERLLGRARAVTAAPGWSELLERALTRFAQLGMPYETARTRWAMADASFTAQPEVAETEARAALAAFEQLGARGDADLVAARLRDHGVRVGRVTSRSVAVLTRREREVLRLLGEGLSNPEIADRLFVSRKTVEHHVAHVLAKLGLKSRAQAAAEAVRRLGEESAGK